MITFEKKLNRSHKSQSFRRLLVTGGAGFIGSNFVHYWCENYPGDRVVVLDALTYAGNLKNLETLKRNSNFRFVHGDISDRPLVDQLLAEEEIDTVAHFAAESHVDNSIKNPNIFVETNVLGTLNLLNLSLKLQKRNHDFRFLHVSTDEVYGSLNENDPAFTSS